MEEEKLTKHRLEDNKGHIKGSRQEGSRETLGKERAADENDDSTFNKTDDRGTLAGNESIS